MQPARRTRIFDLAREANLRRCLSSGELIERDDRYGGRHFKPLPVVLARGEGVYVWDVEGRRYLDFLAGFFTVSHGHSHPRLVKVMRDQVGKLAHTSRAFYSEPHGELAEYLSKLLGWEKFLPMNTGMRKGKEREYRGEKEERKKRDNSCYRSGSRRHCP